MKPSVSTNNRVVFLGGSSSLGKGVKPFLVSMGRDVISLSSKECNVVNKEDLRKNLKSGDHVVFFPVVNIDNLIKDVKTEDVQLMLSVSVIGLINSLQVSYEVGVESFTFISSILSDIKVRGTSVYSANKCFGEKLIDCFVGENRKIRSNIVQLGYFESGLCEKLPSKVRDQALNSIPLGRFGRFEDLASCLDFCFSNDYLNGSKLKLSGGL